MSEWAAKRFWSETSVERVAGGWNVLLDGRPVRTPAKAPLVVPTETLADAMAAEWQAQEGRVDPGTMPHTRMANSALDKVAPQRAAVVEMLVEYGGTDLLCYRADGPAELVARQAEAWDPYLDWARGSLDAPLTTVAGVMFVPQPPASLARLEAQVDGCDPFELAALHDLVALSGSLVLALAATRDVAPPDVLWDVSRIDEAWQIEHWGADDEAAATNARKRRAFLDAKQFFDFCR